MTNVPSASVVGRHSRAVQDHESGRQGHAAVLGDDGSLNGAGLSECRTCCERSGREEHGQGERKGQSTTYTHSHVTPPRRSRAGFPRPPGPPIPTIRMADTRLPAGAAGSARREEALRGGAAGWGVGRTRSGGRADGGSTRRRGSAGARSRVRAPPPSSPWNDPGDSRWCSGDCDRRSRRRRARERGSRPAAGRTPAPAPRMRWAGSASSWLCLHVARRQDGIVRLSSRLRRPDRGGTTPAPS